MIAEIPRSILGEEYDRLTSEPVTQSEIDEFASSLGDSPRDDGAAPPIYCLRFHARRNFHPALPGKALWAGFDAGKEISFGAPIRAGDVITTTSSTIDAYEKTGRSGRMLFVVIRNDLTNQRGEHVATIDTRFASRGT